MTGVCLPYLSPVTCSPSPDFLRLNLDVIDDARYAVDLLGIVNGRLVIGLILHRAFQGDGVVIDVDAHARDVVAGQVLSDLGLRRVVRGNDLVPARAAD